ncbi:MAG TPA: vWA domain-containing protein [Chloroflexia bacterium]|nr:vWA domain-containing protein [Chloroflexia bacterium]
MGILLPVALALLALAVPIIIFYMLRLRRRELDVSSSLLWRRALLDRTANAPWQRLRRNLLLLLQLLLLLLLVVSLARPFLLGSTQAEGNLVVVIDGSASMQAADGPGGATRFEQARREASALVDALAGGSRMTLILAGPSPFVAAQGSDSKAALHSELADMRPSNGRGDMSSALTLAAASSGQLGNAPVVLITDGALSGDLPQMPGSARLVTVGTSARNLAMTSLSLREAPGGPQLFAGAYNAGPEAASGLLTIHVDGALRDSRRVEIEPGGEQTVTLTGLPLDAQQVEATLTPDDPAADVLAADNRAWALRPKQAEARVLLVSEGNGFLEKALALMPGVKVFKAAPAGYAPSPDFRLTVLDGFVPAALPEGSLLVFNPPDSPLVPVSGTVQGPVIGQVAVNDPLLRYVDLSGVHIAQARRMTAPTWARVLVRSTAGDPLLMAGEPGGRRVVVAAFDLHQTDLPLQVAFPILTANLLEWLQPPQAVDAPAALGAGEPVAIRPLPEADEIVVTPPEGGQSVTLQPSASVAFAGTDALGVYTVEQRRGGQSLAEPERFAVNLFSREESNVAPVTGLLFSGAAGEAANPNERRPLEIWPWVLAAALALLAVEWWYYHRAGLLRLSSLAAKRPQK